MQISRLHLNSPVFGGLCAKPRTVEGREAVVRFLSDIAEGQAKKPPRFFMANRWGDWNRVAEVANRDLATVVLAEGQKEDLVADLADFLAREADYARLGIPWHRGYLLHGPPGCGKSSIARAVAAHLCLDVHYLSLSVVENDSYLASLFANVSPRSILVIEDIDIVHGAKSRTDDAKGVTLGGLLNTLDGFLTPHGLVTIMTTNDLEVLDPALVRPGRVDRSIEVGELDDEQLERLVSVFCGPHAPMPKMAAPLTPAAVVGILKRHMDDPSVALTDVAAACRGQAHRPDAAGATEVPR